jgi:two-component system cell cycle response regulator
MTARILVVDDTPINLKLLEAKLSAEYFDVLTAADGPSAIRIAVEELPDLILLDVMMPGMDGFEVCEHLRADARTGHIPIVMITALTETSDRVRGLEAGADDFLSKPVNDVALFARVRSLIRFKMLVDELRTRQAAAGTPALKAGEGDDEGQYKGRVLVVDSDPYCSERLVRPLQECGHQVSLVGDWRSGLEQATSVEGLDLIIVALDVEGGDGLRLCGQFRSQERTRYVPILMVLDEMDLGRLAKGLELGVTDYLVRPVDRNELLARTRTQIRRRRYHDRLRGVLDRSVSLAYTDGLTGIYNRRYLTAHLENRLMEIANNGKPVSVMLFDIDHFKAVNDEHGHAAGDRVLQALSAFIGRNVRDVDLLARYGGEEFVVVMPETSAEVALQVADRLRGKVAEHLFEIGGDNAPLSLSISAGVATTINSVEVAENLLERADKALYIAKRAGRHRVVSGGREAAPLPAEGSERPV